MSQATQYDDFKLLSGTRYILGSNLNWNIGIEESDWLLVIPKGFTFDISVPWYLRWLVSPHHRPWFLASCIHDRLLKLGYDKSFAAGEWFRAARAMSKYDSKSWLVLPAYYGIIIITVR